MRSPIQIIRHLRELIAALDRRSPRVGRVGESAIRTDATALRKGALARIGELENELQSSPQASPKRPASAEYPITKD